MIKIFSISTDHTTDIVIDWLAYHNVKWERLNTIDIQSGKESKHLMNSNFKYVYTIWFRKWDKLIDKASNYDNKSLDTNKEFRELSLAIFNRYAHFFWLNNPYNYNFDKLTQLLFAKKLHLGIPDTTIISTKKDLIKFKSQHKRIITKPLDTIINRKIDNINYINYTRRIDDSEINEIKNNFYPTLIQEEIEKEFEIRTFYLNGDMKSMAIFSQNDDVTSIDFRNYNLNKPNRNVPYILPIKVMAKLDKLMKKLKINCGSIDIIKDKKGEFIFLEVNPLGQFGMVSAPCNYYLEKLVAEFLIKKDETKKEKTTAFKF